MRGTHQSPVDYPTEASDAELWCFLWSAPEQTLQQTIGTRVTRDAIAPILKSLSWYRRAAETPVKFENDRVYRTATRLCKILRWRNGPFLIRYSFIRYQFNTSRKLRVKAHLSLTYFHHTISFNNLEVIHTEWIIGNWTFSWNGIVQSHRINDWESRKNLYQKISFYRILRDVKKK